MRLKALICSVRTNHLDLITRVTFFFFCVDCLKNVEEMCARFGVVRGLTRGRDGKVIYETSCGMIRY